MRIQTHKTKHLGSCANINNETNAVTRFPVQVFVSNALAFFFFWLFFFLVEKGSKLKDKSAWERKCCSSSGSWVLGSVLAAETCPLDEPASAVLSTFGWNTFSSFVWWRLQKEDLLGLGELLCFFLFQDNDGIKQEISVFKGDENPPTPPLVSPLVNKKTFVFPILTMKPCQ